MARVKTKIQTLILRVFLGASLCLAAAANAQPVGGPGAPPGAGGDVTPPTPGETIVIRGRLVNGTTGAPARAERLTLLRLSEGMQPLQTLNNVGPEFAFAPIPVPDGPHLIRAEFQGESYNQMIPPAPRFFRVPQTLTVYDAGAKRADVQITAALQVTRVQSGLRVESMYIIANQSQPARSFSTDELFVYVPEGATEMRGGLRHESSQMAIPLQLTPSGKPGYYRLGRGFRPGSSELTVSYLVEGEKLTDQLLHDPAGDDNSHKFRIVLWRPQNARPVVQGGTVIQENIPGAGEALRVMYPPTGGVQYDFSAGDFLYDGPIEEINPIFDTPLKAGVGLAGVTLLLFLILSFAVQYGRSRQRDARVDRSATP
jgi:hypothetical protein